MNSIKVMKSLCAITFVLSCVVLLGICLQITAAPVNAPRTFPTPQAAADALISAADNFDVPALEQIFGPDGEAIIHSGEPAHDREIAKQFADKAHEKMDVSVDPKTKRRAFISVGDDEWPFPVPIVKAASGWSFDSKAGLNEILLRRVGRDELDAIQICHGFVEAQDDYATSKHGGSHVNQYAQRIISTPGTHDGLAWQKPDGTWDGPVGEKIALAIERGYTSGGTEPYHGYYFKVLKGQGPDAPLGQMDYVVNGAMIGGFALIAFPSQYKVTGVMTFIVSNDGVVYQKDLGPNTPEIAGRIDRFNPDKTWSPVAE
ncbi:MAG TPA: DUF2950 domain-containing protein [Terriglobia bacterium]